MKLLVDSSTIIPKEAFDSIKGKNSNIVAYNDKYRWIFNGKDIKNDTKDVNAALSFEKVSQSAYSTDEDACLIQFKNNGALPGKAEVRIASNYAYNLYNSKGGLFLFYISNNNSQQVKSANIKIKKQEDKKWCTFEINHNSKYVLSGSKVGSNIDKITVKASDIRKASKGGVKVITLGPKVKTINKNAFKGTKIISVTLKTKKLKINSVKGCFKGSKVKTVKVNVGNKKDNKKYVKVYKKIFTKKNASKKVTIK